MIRQGVVCHSPPPVASCCEGVIGVRATAGQEASCRTLHRFNTARAAEAQREGTKKATEKAQKAAGVRSDQKGKTRERVRPSAGSL